MDMDSQESSSQWELRPPEAAWIRLMLVVSPGLLWLFSHQQPPPPQAVCEGTSTYGLSHNTLVNNTFDMISLKLIMGKQILDMISQLELRTIFL